MKTRTQLLTEITRFLGEHEHVITNALQNQARDMRKAAAEAQQAHDHYDKIERPEPREGYIDMTPTKGGFAGMARMFTESAERAERTLEALDQLAGRLEDEEARS